MIFGQALRYSHFEHFEDEHGRYGVSATRAGRDAGKLGPAMRKMSISFVHRMICEA